jgi:hypothetical protein
MGDMSKDESRLGTHQSYGRLNHWYNLFSNSKRRFALIGLPRFDLHAREQGECGFGTRHTLVEIARAVTGSDHIFGIDLSPGMLGMAEKNIRHAGMYEWFHVFQQTLIDCRPILSGAVLSEAGYIVDISVSQTMWGLPIEIMTSRRE